MTVSLLYPSQCMLGESPLWHHERKSCFWTDIENGRLYEFNSISNEIKEWQFNTRVSAVLENKNGDIVLGVQGGIMELDITADQVKWLTDVDSHKENNRCNDAACDSNGRIWIGTMDIHCAEAEGSLYCIDGNLQAERKIRKLTIPNGIVWSENNALMYFIESTSRTVKSYSFNQHMGEIGHEKTVIHIPPPMGMPDGMAIDEEGMLWIALYGGFGIGRWNPRDGELIDIISLPVPNVTNCCFAGENMDQLVITTAREHLSSADLLKYPSSGDVFIIKDIGVKGAGLHKAAYASSY